MHKKNSPSSKTTSWESVSNWYDQIVSKTGHYYHQEVIFPYLEKRLIQGIKKDQSVIELACGQGILEKKLKKETPYHGLDLSDGLLKSAIEGKKSDLHEFSKQDVTHPFDLGRTFDLGFIILALQNFKEPKKAIENLAKHIKPKGKVAIVLNHPCFRIPRQSSWGIDEGKKIQYRRIDRYMEPLEIPISMEPSKGKEGSMTYSYHHSLTDLSKMFSEQGLAIEEIQELCSNKQSEGSTKKMEDRARSEFPLFMALILQKIR